MLCKETSGEDWEDRVVLRDLISFSSSTIFLGTVLNVLNLSISHMPVDLLDTAVETLSNN